MYCINTQPRLLPNKVHPSSKWSPWHKEDIVLCQAGRSDDFQGIGEDCNQKLPRVSVNWPATHMLVEGQIRRLLHLVSSGNRCNPWPRQTLLVAVVCLASPKTERCSNYRQPLTFCESGPPTEMLADNNTAFLIKAFRDFLNEWGILLRFRCAHVPSGNGITERCHRSVKRIVVRKLWWKRCIGIRLLQRTMYHCWQPSPTWSIVTKSN